MAAHGSDTSDFLDHRPATSSSPPLPPTPGPTQVLKKLQALSISYPFWAPVRAEDAPDYGAVVKQPMDLGTISDRLKGEDYATPAQVRADVELVWRNAGAYNGRGHPITVAAAACSTAFKKAWRDVGLG